MNGGVGPNSYVQNSAYQGSALDVAKSIITDEISTKLDVEQLCASSNNPFCIADFGCATGDNSFAAVQMIINAIEKKLLLLNPENNIPEFQVFFTDRVINDFNTLFKSLPAVRQYHVAGVPGNFYDRLFPKDSLHFAYSSWSLHWLSRVPDASLMEMDRPNWNKWKVYSQLRDGDNIIDSAYSHQFSKDIESFLECRAKEVVIGGMMALLLPGVPHSMNPDTDFVISQSFSTLGFCLQDMANEGRISKEKVESFNIPMYFPTPQELEAIIERSPSFGVERMEIITNTGRRALPNAKSVAKLIRSVTEELLTCTFGTEIDMDELFDRYATKIAAGSLYFLNPDDSKDIVILVILTPKSS